MKSMKDMTNTEVLFCDTYALIEIIFGNKNYKKHLNSTLITSQYNLMELYYALLREYNKESADKYVDVWSKYALDIPFDIIKEAMIFKLQNKKENLSYVDCIGYVFSVKNNIRFLTGDIKFRERLHVLYVSK